MYCARVPVGKVPKKKVVGCLSWSSSANVLGFFGLGVLLLLPQLGIITLTSFNIYYLLFSLELFKHFQTSQQRNASTPNSRTIILLNYYLLKLNC